MEMTSCGGIKITLCFLLINWSLSSKVTVTAIAVSPHSNIFNAERSHLSQSTQHIQNFPSEPFNHNYAHKQIVFVALLPSHEAAHKNDCILPKVLPVLELAIAHVQRLGFYHANINITLISRDSFCSSIYGPIGFFEIYTQWREVHAVFGLPCEYVLAPISRYAGVWQIPVLTAAGNAGDFNKKSDSYPTLTRLRGAQANNLGNVVRAIVESFNWTRTALLYQNENRIQGNSVCFFCIAVVHDKLGHVSVLQQGFDTTVVKSYDLHKLLFKISRQVRSK